MAASLTLDRLADITGGDIDLQREIADLYIATSKRYITQLAGAGGDAQRWKKIAHALKGASGNFGAAEMSELARAAELSGPNQSLLASLKSTFDSDRAMLVKNLKLRARSYSKSEFEGA